MGEIYYRKQEDIDVSRLRATIDVAFEYRGHEFTKKGFAGMVSDMLRNKRYKMKRKMTLNPKRKPDINLQDPH